MIDHLTTKEGLVLALLGSGVERFGLELVDRSGGELRRGTVYVTLQRMEEKGLVISCPEATPRSGDRPGGLPRRLYRATALGERLLALQQGFQAAQLAATRSRS